MDKLEYDIKAAQSIIAGMIIQHCGSADGDYFHNFISANERAFEFLGFGHNSCTYEELERFDFI